MNIKLFPPASLKLNKTLSREIVLTGLILLAGVLLRLRQYLTGRSLWLDEAMLALNIVNRDYVSLFKPLDYDQGAPIGFLLVEKTFNLVLGRNELSLRLFPLLIGLVSLWMFYLLLKQITSGVGLWVALALFAFNPRLIYYSSEVKQYIVDVAVTIGLLLVAAPLFEIKRPGRPPPEDLPGSGKGFIRLGLAGFFALWFSHPALFVLAGIEITLVILYLRKRDLSSLWLIIAMGALWLANLGLLYFTTLQGLTRNGTLLDYWDISFVPSPLWSDVGWFARSFRANVAVEFGINDAAGLVFGLMLVGWIALFLEKRSYASALVLTLLFALIASSLRLYPLIGRLIQFLVPLGLLLIGKALEVFHRWIKPRPLLAVIVPLMLSGYLLYNPFTISLEYLIKPKYSEHIRPTLEYFRSAWREGDAMYISYGAVPAFRFYAPAYGLEEIRYEAGLYTDYTDPPRILQRLDSLRGQQRVWILISHVYEQGDFSEKDFLTSYLDQIGSKKREFREPGTSVYLYLYDLSE